MQEKFAPKWQDWQNSRCTEFQKICRLWSPYAGVSFASGRVQSTWLETGRYGALWGQPAGILRFRPVTTGPLPKWNGGGSETFKNKNCGRRQNCHRSSQLCARHYLPAVSEIFHHRNIPRRKFFFPKVGLLVWLLTWICQGQNLGTATELRLSSMTFFLKGRRLQ